MCVPELLPPPAPARTVTHGIRGNLPQILLLLLVNAFVGATIGVERTVTQLLGTAAPPEGFGLTKVTVVTSFIVAFGIFKAVTNLVAGRLADLFGRRRVLVVGWLLGIPVPLMIIFADHWAWVVAANALLGVNQGICWTLTLFMKIDLGGPTRRGWAAGINETIGYGCVMIAAYAGSVLAHEYGYRPVPYFVALGAALLGTIVALFAVRETREHVTLEHSRAGNGDGAPSWGELFARMSFRDRSLMAAVQTGFARNFADGMAWGLLMLLFADAVDVGTKGASLLQLAMLGTFALGQILFGGLSDGRGRKGFIVAGMTLIAASLAWIGRSHGFEPWLVGAIALGLGGALMYPTVIGSLSDQIPPLWRASGLGVYRFWRDLGYAAGALTTGVIADRYDRVAAVYVVAAVCVVSAMVAAAFLRDTSGGWAGEGTAEQAERSR